MLESRSPAMLVLIDRLLFPLSACSSSSFSRRDILGGGSWPQYGVDIARGKYDVCEVPVQEGSQFVTGFQAVEI